MNFLDLQNSTAYFLDDLQFGYFTTTQVKLWLNNAQREVQKRLLKAANNYYLKCVTTTLVVDQRDYVLPLDFKKLHRLEVITSGSVPDEVYYPILPMTLNQKDLASTQSGTPNYYFFKKNRLVLNCAPDTAYTLRLYYSYEVTDMSLDTDEPDVPSAYRELLPLLAAEDGFIKDGRVSALLEKKLRAFEQDMDSDAQERNQDVPRGIVETGFSGGYDWF